MPENTTANLIRFDGVIDNIMYTGDNGFAIMSVKPEKDTRYGMQYITVTGTLFEPRRNDKVRVDGEWVKHPKFGLQIKASSIQVILPDTADGVYKLLKSKGFLSGVGPKTAKILCDAFGGDFFNIVEHCPEKLLEVKGIGKKKLKQIVDECKEKIDMKNIFAFCATYGISPAQGQKIYEVYGGSALTVLLRNPYLLTETNYGIKGIGFKKADAIAAKIGIPKDSPDRISHGVLFVADELGPKSGSTTASRDDVIKKSAEMMELDPAQVEPILTKLLNAQKPALIQDDLDGKHFIWETRVYKREQGIAADLLFLKNQPNGAKIPHDIAHAIDVAETENGIHLADSQREALVSTLKNKVSVTTGGPGVGKTTITRCLINILESEGNDIVCAAPTGRASKRMKEATGHDAMTIHRLLEYSPMDGGFKRNRDNRLDGDVFIFDESSMIDTYIMSCLLEAMPDDAMIVFIGDVDQLPSVGSGQILEDIIKSDAIPVSRLKTIFRQASTSKIITAAHAVNIGKMPVIENAPTDDFFFLETNDCVSCASKILFLMKYIPQKFGCDPLWDVQVLSPKKGSEVGTLRLNQMIQEQSNPDTKIYRTQVLAKDKKKKGIPLTAEDEASLRQYVRTPMIMGKECIFAKGDKVMQTSNNYDKMVFNGEVGVIDSIFPEAKKDKICSVVHYPADDGNGIKAVGYTRDELFSQVSLSYACTIHKSQGSEYPYVIIPMMPTFSIMLQRKLLYTGITRGKKMVVVVGDRKAFLTAVHNSNGVIQPRHTKLRYWLAHPSEVEAAA